jgi:hypothetical protein
MLLAAIARGITMHILLRNLVEVWVAATPPVAQNGLAPYPGIAAIHPAEMAHPNRMQDPSRIG